ncbi:NUDIX hydrolase [Aureivirga marina]|uniref:NUDIX hydrolase n=1 Tax=Aureivirga marina TaxID=1182451 RepID=UPI0018C8DC29|nr:NUDIX domain-containing protein [Aureivirga marina]
MRQNISVAVDAIVFGYIENSLQLLLIERKTEPFKNCWAIPGGFVTDNESLEEAVSRELKEETNLDMQYLEQLYTYGNPDRDPRGHVISIAYFAIVKPDNFEIKADTDAKEAKWFPINDLPDLAFDHAKIIADAKERLQNKLSYQPIGFELLNDKFLFSDLEKLYMTILEKNIDRRNFRKKILSFNILEELDEKVSEGRGRPASLFSFKREKYFELLDKGFVFEIK